MITRHLDRRYRPSDPVRSVSQGLLVLRMLRKAYICCLDTKRVTLGLMIVNLVNICSFQAAVLNKRLNHERQCAA